MMRESSAFLLKNRAPAPVGVSSDDISVKASDVSEWFINGSPISLARKGTSSRPDVRVPVTQIRTDTCYRYPFFWMRSSTGGWHSLMIAAKNKTKKKKWDL
jgi:hypothetical protein